MGNEFVQQWTAHDKQLKGSFEIVAGRIVKVAVDESTHSASGCSIDKLLRFVKDAGARFGADLLDRFQVAFERDGRVEVAHANEVKQLLAQQKISEDTITYDTTISSGDQLRNWKKPLKDTWLRRYLSA